MELSVELWWDFSLWLATTSMILLITSGLLSLYSHRINLYINSKKLRNVSFAVSILFLVTLAIRIISIIFAP